jgi:hypothetical protein
VPGKAEPDQILEGRPLELRPAALLVDILDAQEEPAAALPCRLEAEERRIGVADMQVARGARREAGDERRLARQGHGNRIGTAQQAIVRRPDYRHRHRAAMPVPVHRMPWWPASSRRARPPADHLKENNQA